MKIRINENEVYEIQLKEEISVQELSSILSRLNNLSRYVAKDVFSDAISNLSETGNFKDLKIKTKFTKHTREEILDILKKYYTGTKEEREQVKQTTWIKSKITEYRKKFNIQPEEIGLKKFPDRDNHDIILMSGKINKNKPLNIERNEVIKYLKLYYHDKDELKRIAVTKNSSFPQFIAKLFYYKKNYDIKPKEVGLTKFKYG